MARPRKIKKAKKVLLSIDSDDYYYLRLLGVDNFSDLVRNMVKGFLYNRICPTCGSHLKTGPEPSRLIEESLQD